MELSKPVLTNTNWDFITPIKEPEHIGSWEPKISLTPAGDTPAEPGTPDQPGGGDQPETFIPPPNFDVEDPSTYPDYLIPKPDGLSESAKLAFSGRRTRHPSNSISGRFG